MTLISILIQITYIRITVCFAAIRPGGTNNGKKIPSFIKPYYSGKSHL